MGINDLLQMWFCHATLARRGNTLAWPHAALPQMAGFFLLRRGIPCVGAAPEGFWLGGLERDGLPGGLSGRVKARAWGWRGSPSVAAPCAAFLRCHMGDRLILQSGVAGNLYQIRTIRPTGAP